MSSDWGAGLEGLERDTYDKLRGALRECWNDDQCDYLAFKLVHNGAVKVHSYRENTGAYLYTLRDVRSQGSFSASENTGSQRTRDRAEKPMKQKGT